MAIKTGTNFSVGTNLPIDERFVVETYDELASMNNAYEGLQVYVKEDGKFYVCTESDGTFEFSETKSGGQDIVDFASEAELQAIIEGGNYSIGNIYRYTGTETLRAVQYPGTDTGWYNINTNSLVLITKEYSDESWSLDSFCNTSCQIIKTEIPTPISTTVDVESDVEADNYLEDIPGNDGDTLIIRKLIADGKYSYTAYVRYNGAWCAMDGNYSAENVYFPSNLTTTKAIGYVTLDNGQATIAAEGKNLVDVWNTIFVEEDTNLKKTNPSASISVTAKYLEVGSSGTVTATMSLDDGAYDYGYTLEEGEDGDAVSAVTNNGTTGVKATSYTLDGTTQTSNSFTIASGGKTAKGTKSISGTVNHTAGYTPVSNLKKMYPSQAFAANTALSAGSKTAFYWYVPMYHGFKYSSALIADPKNITADEIKELGTTINGDAAYKGTKPTTATATGSWRQYFVAVPSDYNVELSKILDSNSLPLTVEKANNVTITFGSGDNKADIVYEVFYVNNAADYDTAKINLTW